MAYDPKTAFLKSDDVTNDAEDLVTRKQVAAGQGTARRDNALGSQYGTSNRQDGVARQQEEDSNFNDPALTRNGKQSQTVGREDDTLQEGQSQGQAYEKAGLNNH